MKDRELLELAAMAAGVEVVTPTMLRHRQWNPLTDDGDALRLAVKLNIWIHPDKQVGEGCTSVMVGDVGLSTTEEWGPMRDGSEDDPYAATRRAIVRAAAEIGKEMP